MADTFQFDPLGVLLANKITDEQQILTGANHRNQYFIVPHYAPFFADSLKVIHIAPDGSENTLALNVDYFEAFEFIGASRATAKPIYGGISFLNTSLTGVVKISYQTLGGPWVVNENQIVEILSDTLRNPRITSWEMVANTPEIFPPIEHEWNLIDMVGIADVKQEIAKITQAIIDKPTPVFTAPQAAATKNTVGLGNVDNYATANDTQSQEGNSSSLFMTPRGVKKAIEFKLSQLQDAIDRILGLAAQTGAAMIRTITGQTLDKAGTFVKTIDELRKLGKPNLTNDETFFVTCLGINNYGDSNVAKYYWRNSETEDDDGIYVIKPDSHVGNGRWVNVQKDAWATEVHPITDANSKILTLDNTPVYSKPLRIVANKIIELVYKVDFDVSGKNVYFYNNIIVPGDIIDVTIQLKEIDSNSPKLNVYQTWDVLQGQTVFPLSQKVIQPKGCRLVLNDIINLIAPIDFYVNNIDKTITVTYPLKAEDKLELKSVNSLPEFGITQTRALLNPTFGDLAYQDLDEFKIAPKSNALPVNRGEMVFQLTSNTTLTVKVKGTDGVVRSANIVLSNIN